MSDFTIDVGFNTDELKEATKGASGGEGGQSGAGKSSGIKSAFKAALVGTGVIALLKNLKSILEIIGFALAVISALVGLLTVKLLEWTKSYFGEFERNNLKIAIFTANAIIGAIEFVVNAIIGLSNLFIPKGKEFENVELPRFQEEIILESFDALQQVKTNVEAGIKGVDELTQAQKDYEESFIDAFLTESDFEAVKQIKEMNNITFQETLSLLDSAGQDVNSAIDSGSTQVINFTDSAFNAMAKALQHMEDKAKEFTSGRTKESKGGNFVRFKADEKKSTFEKNLDFIGGLFG